MLNYYASILFLMVMSIDRYLAINHAMNSIANKLRSVRAVRLVSIVVWTICFSAVTHILWTAHVLPCNNCAIKFAYDQDQDASEYAYLSLNDSDYAAMDYDYGDEYGSINTTDSSYQSVEDIINNTPACRIEEKQLKLWLVTNFLVAFLFPLLVIIVCYAHILHKISQPMTVGSKSASSNKMRKRVTRMVTMLVSAFVMCWLPYHSFKMSQIVGNQLNIQQCNNFKRATLVLAYINSALNPFLYTFLGTNFKRRFSEAYGKTRSFRPSFGSRTDYASGVQYKNRKRRRSSATRDNMHDSISGSTFSQSAVTKNTIVPSMSVNPTLTEKNCCVVTARMDRKKDGYLPQYVEDPNQMEAERLRGGVSQVVFYEWLYIVHHNAGETINFCLVSYRFLI